MKKKKYKKLLTIFSHFISWLLCNFTTSFFHFPFAVLFLSTPTTQIPGVPSIEVEWRYDGVYSKMNKNKIFKETTTTKRMILAMTVGTQDCYLVFS